MSVQRIPASGPPPKGQRVRWKARVKQGRIQVATRTFDTEKAAEQWHDRQLALLEGSYDPRLGKTTLQEFIKGYLEWRETRVQETTFVSDKQMIAQLPQWLLHLELKAITSAHVERWQTLLLKRGLKPSSVMRHRQAFSPMLQRAVKEGFIAVNPVRDAETPGSQKVDTERINPYGTLEELLGDVRQIATHDPVIADIYLVLARLGPRWSEARALTVADYTKTGLVPLVRIDKAQPEGKRLKVTKSGKPRATPVEPILVPILDRFAEGKAPGDLLLTTAQGAQLHRTPFVRTAQLVVPTDEYDENWNRHYSKKDGARRIHDLRHTAAVLWLTAGVPLHVVKEWLGHASIRTTERYLQHVGGAADVAALSLVSASWGTLSLDSGGTEGGLNPSELVEGRNEKTLPDPAA